MHANRFPYNCWVNADGCTDHVPLGAVFCLQALEEQHSCLQALEEQHSCLQALEEQHSCLQALEEQHDCLHSPGPCKNCVATA